MTLNASPIPPNDLHAHHHHGNMKRDAGGIVGDLLRGLLGGDIPIPKNQLDKVPMGGI
ncbi:hypothetical protein H4219_005926, partial [Mycoemilia scoparia]